MKLEGDPYVIRRYETDLGNMLADAATEAAERYLGPEYFKDLPRVTIINAGAVRDSLPAVSACLGWA